MEKLFVKKLDDGREFKVMVRLIDNSVTVPFGTMCEYLGIDRTYWTKKLYHDLIRSTDREFIYLITFQFRLQKIKPKSSDGRYWKKVILDLHPGEMLFYNIGKNQETETINAESEKKSQEMDLKEQTINYLENKLKLQKALTKDWANRLKEVEKQSERRNQEYKNLGAKYNNLCQKRDDMFKSFGITELKSFQDIISDKNKELTETKDQLEFVRVDNQNLRFELANDKENIEFLQEKNKELKKQQRKLNQALGIDLLNMAQQLLNMKEV